MMSDLPIIVLSVDRVCKVMTLSFVQFPFFQARLSFHGSLVFNQYLGLIGY